MVVRALASHPMWPGFGSLIRCLMWAEFVGSLPCSERFFSGYSGFPLSHTAPQAYSFKIVTAYKVSLPSFTEVTPLLSFLP